MKKAGEQSPAVEAKLSTRFTLQEWLGLREARFSHDSGSVLISLSLGRCSPKPRCRRVVGVTSTCSRFEESETRCVVQFSIRSEAPKREVTDDSGVLATASLAPKDFPSAQLKLMEAVVDFAASSKDQCQTKNF
jgi:hypothetical protein